MLIRVRFAGVNPLDNNLLGRLNADSSYPFVLGIDFAGVAERVPAGDHGLRVGDRVLGMARTHGSYAERTAVAPAATMEPLAKIPDGVADDQAASRWTSSMRSAPPTPTASMPSDRRESLISPQGLTTVGQMLADGAITARIGSTVDLDGAGQVLEDLRHGRLHGKAIIRL